MPVAHVAHGLLVVVGGRGRQVGLARWERKGSESPCLLCRLCNVTVTEHADAMHAKAGRSQRAWANLSKLTQERAN